jgi:hypothetical protein
MHKFYLKMLPAMFTSALRDNLSPLLQRVDSEKRPHFACNTEVFLNGTFLKVGLVVVDL